MKKLLICTFMIALLETNANGIKINNYPGLAYDVILSVNCNNMKICKGAFTWKKPAHNWTSPDQFNIITELQKYENIEAVDIKIKMKGQLMDCLYIDNINKNNKTQVLNEINAKQFNLSLTSGGQAQCTWKQ